MKLLLIQPAMGKIEGRGYVRSWSMAPLWAATLAALTPPEVEVRFVDDRFDPIPFDTDADLVGITVETYTALRGYRLAAEFRRRGIPVVLGGMQVALLPDEAAAFADAIVIGDAESVWPQVIRDVQSGTLQARYQRSQIGKALEHTPPRRDLFAGRPYIKMHMVEAGRGCPFDCDFCAIAGAHQRSYRAKAPRDIASDIESLPSGLIYFVDDNFVSIPKNTKDLCRELAPLRRKWFSHGSLTMANDDELLRLLARSGCANILIGFESLNADTLRMMGKSWNVARRDYREAVRKIRDAGITIYATFVFGYDNDREDDVRRTLDFAIEQQFALAAFNHLVPFPGTPLIRRLEAEGRLLSPAWWLDERFRFGDVTFRPRHLSSERLSRLCYEARREFYGLKSIARRALDFHANCRGAFNAAAFFYSNFISGRAVRDRQSWPVGLVEPPASSRQPGPCAAYRQTDRDGFYGALHAETQAGVQHSGG